MAGPAPIDAAEIERRFRHVPPDGRRAAMHVGLRQDAISFGRFLAVLLPESREKSLAITALEECLMRANQCIALNVPDAPAEDDGSTHTGG